MSDTIIAAIIGAGAVIFAAVIGLIAKSISKNKTIVKQVQKGNNNKQVGVINKIRSDKNE